MPASSPLQTVFGGDYDCGYAGIGNVPRWFSHVNNKSCPPARPQAGKFIIGEIGVRTLPILKFVGSSSPTAAGEEDACAAHHQFFQALQTPGPRRNKRGAEGAPIAPVRLTE